MQVFVWLNPLLSSQYSQHVTYFSHVLRFIRFQNRINQGLIMWVTGSGQEVFLTAIASLWLDCSYAGTFNFHVSHILLEIINRSTHSKGDCVLCLVTACVNKRYSVVNEWQKKGGIDILVLWESVNQQVSFHTWKSNYGHDSLALN